MNWFNNLKVSSKLIGGFLIVAAIGAIIGTQGILKVGKINDMAIAMYEQETLGLRHTANANANAQMIAAAHAIRNATQRNAILASSDKRAKRPGSAAGKHEDESRLC